MKKKKGDGSVNSFLEKTHAPPKINENELREKTANMLSNPLLQNSISYCICNNCGQYGQIGNIYFKALLKIHNALNISSKVNVDPKKIYFVTSYCEICSNKEDKEEKLNVVIKDI